VCPDRHFAPPGISLHNEDAARDIGQNWGPEQKLARQQMKFPGVHTFGFLWDRDALQATEDLAAQDFRDFQYLAGSPHLDPWTSDRTLPLAVRRAVD
jgi:hypothetical protein